jgi:tetratricopeptide (TPR) repeat protein
MLRALFVVVSVLFAAGVVHAQPEATPTAVFIVGGGKTEADAEKAKVALVKHVWLWRVQEYPAWPQVMRSDDVPGLKPGLWIAVAATCTVEDNGAAAIAALEKSLKRVAKGTYTRTVTAALGNACFARGLFEPDAAEKALQQAVDAAPPAQRAAPMFAYAKALYAQSRLLDAQIVTREVLRLDAKHAEALKLSETLMVLLTD